MLNSKKQNICTGLTGIGTWGNNLSDGLRLFGRRRIRRGDMYGIHVQIITDVQKYKDQVSDMFKTNVPYRSISDIPTAARDGK